MFGNAARERRAIEKTYFDSCNVFKLVEYKEKNISKFKRELVYENQPCALSQKSLRPSEQTESQNKVETEEKLFIAPELIIEPGSEIEVSCQGRTETYKSSGKPFVYTTHQEVILKISKRA